MPDGNAPKPAKISQAKGRPWIHWVGKRGIEEIAYFPAQETERFDPYKEIEADSWSNLLFHGDNKEVMGHLLHQFRGEVDLVYIDPPFDSKADYVRKVQLRGPRGNQITGEEQSLLEQVQYNDLWANDEYLQFMYERLILLRELMSETGSIYLHCDAHQNHRLRCLMDEVFGAENFQNEIIWCYTRMASKGQRKFNNTHQTVLFYKKGHSYTFDADQVRDAYAASSLNRAGYKKTSVGSGAPSSGTCDLNPLGKFPDDWWTIPFERSTEYPTQKPALLLEKIVKVSSEKDDLVLDIFCGSGTTAAVAQKLGRRWIMADINHGAIQTTSKRLQDIISAGKVEKDAPKPASRNFRVFKVNDYDLQIQHNEALEFAIDKIGIQRTPQDGFFEGVVGDRLVKIIPLNRPANIADLDSIEREIAEIRPDDTRDILVVALGAETNVRPWIEEKNKLRQHAKNNRYELKDLRETGFFEHRPAEADIAVKKEGGKVKVKIRDFHSPTICARLDIANDRAVIKAEIPDFRSQIDCVMIDLDYNRKVFDIDFSDLPAKKSEMVNGAYEFDATACGKQIAVKVVDMLGEEVIEVIEI